MLCQLLRILNFNMCVIVWVDKGGRIHFFVNIY